LQPFFRDQQLCEQSGPERDGRRTSVWSRIVTSPDGEMPTHAWAGAIAPSSAAASTTLARDTIV